MALEAGVQQALDQMSEVVEAIRKQVDATAAGAKTVVELKEFKEKASGDFETFASQLSALETKLNRPGFLAGGNEPAVDEVKKAFDLYARKGEQALTPDQVKYLSTDDSTQGGYLVAPTVSNEVLKEIIDISPVRQYADVQTIGGAVWQQPTQSGMFAGGWVGERQARADTTNALLGMLSIEAHEMYAQPKATQTMLDDANFDLEGWIRGELATTFAYYEGDAFINGTGVGQPEGIMVNADVDEVHSGDADNVTTDGMRKLEFGIRSLYSSRGIFMCHRNTILELALLKDDNKQYLWKPDLTGGSGWSTFDGRPVVEDASFDEVGAGVFPVVYGDFKSGYRIVDNPKIVTIRDIYTDKPWVKFYTTRRVGGRVIRPDAFIKLECAV